MTIEQLIQALSKEDPKAEVGIVHSKTSGYVNKINDVKHTKDGLVVIDLAEETIGEEEHEIQRS
jgi:acetaldehyde dehydrogenase (acetylating)